MSEENIITYIFDPDNPPPLTAEQEAMLARLDAMPDSEIDLSDAPECDFVLPGPKTDAALRLDSDVLAWLAESRHGADWKANFVLRHEMLRERGHAELARRRTADEAAAASAASEAAGQPVHA